jgi:hypothetical protein
MILTVRLLLSNIHVDISTLNAYIYAFLKKFKHSNIHTLKIRNF